MNTSARSWRDVQPHQTQYDRRISEALKHARKLSDEELLHLPEEVIIEALTDEHAAANVIVHFDQMWWELRNLPYGGCHIKSECVTELCINFPTEGSVDVLWSRNGPIDIHLAKDGPTIVTFKVHITDAHPLTLTPEVYRQMVTDAQGQLRALESSGNQEISTQREELRRQVEATINQRLPRIRAFYRAADMWGIPVKPYTDCGKIELHPRKLTLRQLDEALQAGDAEWHLEENIAEDIISTIVSFTTALERLTVTASKLVRENEETIRDLLLFVLNANYQGTATGETFVGYGKTDILLRWRDRDAFIGECKFRSGPEHFTSAIGQLLNRYTVWRDTRVALILFIRDIVDITSIIEKAGVCIAGHERLLQAFRSQEPDRRRDYLLRAANDEQRIIRLTLLPVVIPLHVSSGSDRDMPG